MAYYIRIDYHGETHPMPYWVSDLPGGRTTYLELRTRFASRDEARRAIHYLGSFSAPKWLTIVEEK